jgi:dihydropteroate synthase
VTGHLAEFALRQVLESLSASAGFAAEVAVLPISVAALMTPAWIARHLAIPQGVDRVILPGHCRGDLGPLTEKSGGIPVVVGPVDLRDLPAHFGCERHAPPGYGAYRIEIIAEINGAAQLSGNELIDQARQFQAQGADVIDLGCDPGGQWTTIGEAVAALRDLGIRVSVDSFNPAEVKGAVSAGAELVLSVSGSNRQLAPDWGVEVVAIPDQAGTLDGLDQTIEFLARHDVPFRIDPILEPIGFGFAASLGRFLEVRRRYPGSEMLMGVANLTELTDVDSAGVNTVLVGFCEEMGIRSVLTTAVINWAQSSIREIDLARRLAHHAVAHRTLPKHLEPGLVTLRDPRVLTFGAENLVELQRRIRDPNWRLFAEGRTIYALNNQQLLQDSDPFAIFDRMGVSDAPHAFYLGYEMMKARTALTLSKTYRQDQALEWGFLTEPEESHLEKKRLDARRKSRTGPPVRPDDERHFEGQREDRG